MDYIDPTLPTVHDKALRGLRGVHIGSRSGCSDPP